MEWVLPHGAPNSYPGPMETDLMAEPHLLTWGTTLQLPQVEGTLGRGSGPLHLLLGVLGVPGPLCGLGEQPGPGQKYLGLTDRRRTFQK
jgi:hypothetical protein